MIPQANELRITISPKQGLRYPVLINAPAVFGNPAGDCDIDLKDDTIQDTIHRMQNEQGGDRTFQKQNLIIPHRHLNERRFVLVPLSEIAAEVKVPPGDQTVQMLLNQCHDMGKVTYYST